MYNYYRLFRAGNKRPQDQKEMTSGLTLGITSFLLLLIHLMFLVYFYSRSITPMILLNMASVICYIFALQANYHHHSTTCSLIMVIEVSIYCLVSTYFIGWNAGTQNFLPIMVAPCHLIFNHSRIRAYIYSSILSLSMVGCYVISRVFTPVLTIDFSVLLFMNTVVCMIGAVLVVAVLDFSHRVTFAYFQDRIDSLTGEANKDVLTHMWNRRYGQQYLEKLFIDNSTRQGAFIGMVDIDYFKRINDTYGHTVGDSVLKQLAKLMFDNFRSTDVACRWGGEEFLIILNNTTHSGAFRAFDHFRTVVEQSTLKAGDANISITITIGYSWCMDSNNYTGCINQSDQALYYGKRNGRNKTVYYSDLPLDHNLPP